MENNLALFYLVLALLIHFGIWATFMYQVSWFRVFFLLQFDKKHDNFFENTLIVRTLESSAISFSMVGLWACYDSHIFFHYLVYSLPLAWALIFYCRMYEITQVCARSEKDYRRIEKLSQSQEFPFFSHSDHGIFKNNDLENQPVALQVN